VTKAMHSGKTARGSASSAVKATTAGRGHGTGPDAGLKENEDRDDGIDRRMAERVAVDWNVDYSSDETFLFASSASISNLSALGIFVETKEPSEVGTKLNLKFVPPDAEEPFAFEGEVVWVNPFRPDGSNLNPGMGIRFVDLTIEQRQRLVDLVRRIAFLPSD